MFKKYLILFLGAACFLSPYLKAADSLDIKIKNDKYLLHKNETSLELLSGSIRSTNKLSISSSYIDGDHEEEVSRKDIYFLNNILNTLKVNNIINTLSISGFIFNDESISIIGEIINIHTLNFEECSFGNVSNFHNLSLLRSLKNLTVKSSRFLNDNTNADIPFKGFVGVLQNLNALQTLDFEGSALFPEVRIKKYYSGSSRKKTVLDQAELDLGNYMNWRSEEIKACANLLVSSFCGANLILKDTRLGDIFIESFIEALEKSYLIKKIKIDFSDNFIPLSSAVNFVIRLADKEVTVTFEGNTDNRSPYSAADIRYEVYEHFIRNLNLEG